jgi:queuine tRNA-ribosyltransferase
MSNPSLSFELLSDGVALGARRGRLRTRRGTVDTPAFMPVGTQATVRTLDPVEVARTGAQIILANTYHLMIRPGVEILEEARGLHAFMQWPGPILTDSGGFQIFSLATQAKVSEEGVTFRSHFDGTAHLLTPEGAVDLQARYGSDIMMPLDHLIGLPASRRKIADAADRTERWLTRAIEEHQRRDSATIGALFGICQGGVDPELRVASAQQVAAKPVSGVAIGGLSVGEPKDVMASMLEYVAPHLPIDKPRYLMGVGSPEDLWEGIARGVDMFDCVLPTRLARHGALFTPFGRIDITNRRFRSLQDPVDSTCDCDTCSRFSAAYLHHLFRAREILGLRLATIHNLRFLARVTEQARLAIEEGRFDRARATFLVNYQTVSATPSAA